MLKMRKAVGKSRPAQLDRGASTAGRKNVSTMATYRLGRISTRRMYRRVILSENRHSSVRQQGPRAPRARAFAFSKPRLPARAPTWLLEVAMPIGTAPTAGRQTRAASLQAWERGARARVRHRSHPASLCSPYFAGLAHGGTWRSYMATTKQYQGTWTPSGAKGGVEHPKLQLYSAPHLALVAPPFCT